MGADLRGLAHPQALWGPEMLSKLEPRPQSLRESLQLVKYPERASDHVCPLKPSCWWSCTRKPLGRGAHLVRLRQGSLSAALGGSGVLGGSGLVRASGKRIPRSESHLVLERCLLPPHPPSWQKGWCPGLSATSSINVGRKKRGRMSLCLVLVTPSSHAATFSKTAHLKGSTSGRMGRRCSLHTQQGVIQP